MKIKKSPKLGRALEEANAILLCRQDGDEEVAYRNFYNALLDTSPHGKLIQENEFTLEEMIEISQNLRKAGYGIEVYFYLPVFAFYRLKTLKYILKHREELRKQKGREAFNEAAMGLKQAFAKMVFGMLYPG